MKNKILFLFALIFLVGCAPSEEMMATALSKTLTAMPTITPIPTLTPTNTPSATNTPRPTPTPNYGSITNPFPFGMEVALSQGTANFTLTVTEVIRGQQALQIIKSANMFNDDPPEGMEFALVRIKLKYIDGSGVITYDQYEFVSISQGQIFDSWEAYNPCCLDDAGYTELNANLALPGAETEGWLAIAVFISDQNPMLAINIDTYSPDLDEGLFFSIIK